MRTSLKIWSAGTAIAAALALGACHPTANAGADGNTSALPALPATLPMTAGSASTPTYAPTADALPAAPRVRTVRLADPRNGYAYADNASDFGDAVFDAPPDYGFDYAGVEPWAWQGYDQSTTFVEPIDDGYRYYYYRPGADEPYFVRDPDYGYGYDNGQLAVIYGAGGAILPYADYGQRIDYASRYLARGRDLYAASRERDRRAVNAANWAARSAAISAAQARWAAERAQQSAWRAYHQRVADDADRHWQEERVRRQADAQRFAQWQRSDYRTAPPPRVIPAAWQQARWARDDRRYVALPARPLGMPQRDVGADQARQQAQRDLGREQHPPAVTAAPARSAPRDREGADEMARSQADRAAQPATAGQQRAAQQQQREAQRQQALTQPRGAQRDVTQARPAQRAQADNAREQAQAARMAARAQSQASAREQAHIAQTAGRDQTRARDQAAGQARAEARQQARAQAQGQMQAARAEAQAARAQAQARPQRPAPQPQIRRPPPQPQRPAPQPAAPQQRAGGPGNGGHDHHPG